jgi:hypothetical protein
MKDWTEHLDEKLNPKQEKKLLIGFMCKISYPGVMHGYIARKSLADNDKFYLHIDGEEIIKNADFFYRYPGNWEPLYHEDIPEFPKTRRDANQIFMEKMAIFPYLERMRTLFDIYVIYACYFCGTEKLDYTIAYFAEDVSGTNVPIRKEFMSKIGLEFLKFDTKEKMEHFDKHHSDLVYQYIGRCQQEGII